MSTEFIMPKLGLTMEEGTILEWLVEDGAEITAGMPVLRIETDKVESDVESPHLVDSIVSGLKERPTHVVR